MNKNFYIVAFIAFLNALGLTTIIPVLYPYATNFGLNDFQASLLLASYAGCQFLAAPILGKLSDRYGRKPVLIISLLGTFLSGLLATFAGSAVMLFIARILDGITGGNDSVVTATMVDITDDKTRAKGFGIIGGAFGLGFIVGPVFSLLMQTFVSSLGQSVSLFGFELLISENFKLGSAFLTSSFFALLATLLTIFILPETLPDRSSEKITLKTLGFGKVFKGLQMPKIWFILVTSFFSGVTFTIFTFAFQPYFLNNLNQDTQTLTISFALFGLIGVISQVFVMPKLINRFDTFSFLVFSFFIRSLFFLLIPLFPSFAYLIFIICTFGLAIHFPRSLISILISQNAKSTEQGLVAGLNSSYLSLANVFGPMLGGLLVGLGYDKPFYIAGFFTLLLSFWLWSSRSILKKER